MSRWVYLLGVGVTLVALALAFTDWALSLRPGVTEANVRRIRAGMTMREVEALLGGPGRYMGNPRDELFTSDKGVFQWTGADGWAEVTTYAGLFAAIRRQQPVIRVEFFPKNNPGPLARLRAWLGW